MRKIKLIREFSRDSIKYNNPNFAKLVDAYMVSTFSKTRAISNLSDLISDIDALVEKGRDEYLKSLYEKQARYEDILLDTMHGRNLFVMTPERRQHLEEEERSAYVARSNIKIELQYIETNAQHVNQMVDILRKINRFTEVKNERVYTARVLDCLHEIIEEEDDAI